MHDVLEDTDTEAEELHQAFGPEVANAVVELTEDAGIAGTVERKAELRRRIGYASAPIAVIFAADKVAKVRELRIKKACNPSAAGPDPKFDHYKACLPMLERALTPDHRLVAELRFELEALIALPPA